MILQKLPPQPLMAGILVFLPIAKAIKSFRAKLDKACSYKTVQYRFYTLIFIKDQGFTPHVLAESGQLTQAVFSVGEESESEIKEKIDFRFPQWAQLAITEQFKKTNAARLVVIEKLQGVETEDILYSAYAVKVKPCVWPLVIQTSARNFTPKGTVKDFRRMCRRGSRIYFNVVSSPFESIFD